VQAPGENQVCPLEGSGILVTLLAPDGSVADTMSPDAYGVTGGGDCGSGDNEIPGAAAGTWKVRFAGEGQARVFMTLVAVGNPT
jgi:hypothetical protein